MNKYRYLKRAYRRRCKFKMKQKARRLYPFTECPEKYADYLAVCSCPGCGNPRRHFDAKTLQETKHEYYNEEE